MRPFAACSAAESAGVVTHPAKGSLSASRLATEERRGTVSDGDPIDR
jgi:hypothetical protein